MKRKMVATLVTVPLVLGVTAAHAPVESEQTPSGSSEEQQEFTQEYLALSSPIYADTVPALTLEPDVVFAGVRYENGPMVGEDYYTDQSDTAWALDFEAMYGTDPRITHIIVMVPSEEEEAVPREVSASQSQPAHNTVDDLAAGTISVPAGTPVPVDGIDPLSDIAVQYEEAQVAAAEAPATSAVSASAAAVYWSPTFTEHGVRPVNLPSGPRAGFYNFHSWSGADHQPAHLDINHGIEFETNLYDLTGPWSGSRPACSVLPFPFIAVPDYKEQFWAVNYNWSWSALSNTGSASLALPYADINDLFDDCSRQSIAIGLEYPQNLYDGSGYSDFMYVVNAPFGVESSSGVAGVLQTVENVSCRIDAAIDGFYIPTDCMGLNGQVARTTGDTSGSYLTLSRDRGYSVPSLCWRNTSNGVGLDFDRAFNCSQLGGG